MSKPSHTHGYHHTLQVLAGERFQWLLDVQMIGDTPQMMVICSKRDFRQSLCRLGYYEVIKYFFYWFVKLSI